MALFALGAILPFLALAVLGLAGTFLALAALGWFRPLSLAVAAFLLGNAFLGLRVALQSFGRPPGRVLKSGEAPELEERLARAQKAWKGPRAPEIVLAPDAWSIELTGVPVAGMFGWCRFHWYIGIYPLLALSLAELDALLSWEVIFWSDYQGWFNLQAKRLAAYWYRVHLSLLIQDREGAAWRRICTLFLRPYARWFVGTAQPFLAGEFVRADRAAAEKHGVPTLVRALCRQAILKPLVARRVFAPWEDLLEKSGTLPEDLYGTLAEALGRAVESGEGMLALALDGIQREAPPLLRLRLHCLEVEAQVPMPPLRSAGSTLLGPTGLLEEIQGLWKERIQETVRAVQHTKRENGLRFLELAAAMPGCFPDHPDSREYLALAFDHAPWQEFDALLGAFRQAHPESVEGGMLSVRRSLQRGLDRRAVLEARELLLRDPLLASDCHEVLARHLRGRGDHRNAEREWDRAMRAAEVAARARRERESAALPDLLEPHGCDAWELRELRRVCLKDARILEAHLARKRVSFHENRPVLLLVVRWRGPWWDLSGRRRRAFQRELQETCAFPEGATGFVTVAGPGVLWWFRDKLRQVDGVIFRRGL
jgi:hypothetical protein